MATVIKHRRFGNKTGRLECIRLGWHRGHCTFDIIKEFESVRAASAWIKAEIDDRDYVLFPEGEVYFRNERDLLLFTLKWN